MSVKANGRVKARRFCGVCFGETTGKRPHRHAIATVPEIRCEGKPKRRSEKEIR